MCSIYLILNKLNFWTFLANLEYCGALNCPKTRLQIAFLFWKLMATLDRQVFLRAKEKYKRSTECPGKDKRCKLYGNSACGPPREDSICRQASSCSSQRCWISMLIPLTIFALQNPLHCQGLSCLCSCFEWHLHL